VKSLLHGGTIIHRTKAMSSGSKVVRDGSEDREKALSVSRRFEAAHGSFTLPHWVMRVFRSIVQTFVLAVLDAGHHLFLGGCIASKLVGNNHARDIFQSFEQRAEELF
jgi:hypothetical protein